MSIDIGNECVDCRRDTSEGRGLFVNRIPADRQDGVDDEHIIGYLCPDCQLIECDKCGEPADCSGYSHMYVDFPRQTLIGNRCDSFSGYS